MELIDVCLIIYYVFSFYFVFWNGYGRLYLFQYKFKKKYPIISQELKFTTNTIKCFACNEFICSTSTDLTNNKLLKKLYQHQHKFLRNRPCVAFNELKITCKLKREIIAE